MSRERREIIFSIIVLITIPGLMLAGTLIFYSAIRQLYNEDIRHKANLANSVMAESLRADIASENYAVLAEELASIKSEAPELVNLAVYHEKDSQIEILAKTDDVSDEVSDSLSLQVRIVMERRQPVAKLEKLETANGIIQAWSVSTPLIDSKTQEVIAVVSSGLSTADSDELIDNTLKLPLYFGIASVIIVLILLFRHLRFVEYARLLARQREINQTMSDFLSVATHELKAPTTIIKGYISNAMDDLSNPLSESTKQQLNVALSQTDRLNNLVQDLLNVSRIEQGRVEYKMQNVALTDIVAPVVANYQLIAKGKNIEIKYQPDASLKVYADPGRVQEIFTNLIDNAVKYSLQGTISIYHRVDDKFVISSIRDSGIGMTSEQRKRLFQRFYRIKDEQTKDISGTGLGLWIIKQYIEAMGGSIDVDSMTGVGTEFSVSLPKAK